MNVWSRREGCMCWDGVWNSDAALPGMRTYRQAHTYTIHTYIHTYIDTYIDTYITYITYTYTYKYTHTHIHIIRRHKYMNITCDSSSLQSIWCGRDAAPMIRAAALGPHGARSVWPSRTVCPKYGGNFRCVQQLPTGAPLWHFTSIFMHTSLCVFVYADVCPVCGIVYNACTNGWLAGWLDRWMAKCMMGRSKDGWMLRRPRWEHTKHSVDLKKRNRMALAPTRWACGLFMHISVCCGAYLYLCCIIVDIYPYTCHIKNNINKNKQNINNQ